MNKVTTVNLGGNAYQVDEAGFEALQAYLSSTREKLSTNPDKEEILVDLEQAIGFKFRALLNPHKTVVNAAEVDAVLTEMGTVDGEPLKNKDGTEKSKDEKVKKLYQLKDGAMISGVCMGIAAYLDLDVTIVRVVFVIISIASGGAGILAYFVLSLIIPVAQTPEEKMAAHGTMPVTAQTLIDRAKENYGHLTDKQEWKNRKQEWKRYKHSREQQYKETARHRSAFWEFMHALLGMAWVVFLFGAFLFAYNEIPAVHEVVNKIPEAFQAFITALKN